MKRAFPVTLGFLLLPTKALAVSITQFGWSCAGFLHCGSGTDAVQTIATNITVGITATITSLAVITFLYGAIRMTTSQGGEGKDAGKKAMVWSAVGLIAAILAGGIILYVQQLIYSVASS